MKFPSTILYFPLKLKYNSSAIFEKMEHRDLGENIGNFLRIYDNHGRRRRSSTVRKIEQIILRHAQTAHEKICIIFSTQYDFQPTKFRKKLYGQISAILYKCLAVFRLLFCLGSWLGPFNPCFWEDRI